MWEVSSDFIAISWLWLLKMKKIVWTNQIQVCCNVIECHMTRYDMWKCGGNHFPQTEDLNKSKSNLGYKSRSILLHNMMNVWKVLGLRRNCLLTFQLVKEPTLFISMSTIMFWYIVSMGKQPVPDVTLNNDLNTANITWWFITTRKWHQ